MKIFLKTIAILFVFLFGFSLLIVSRQIGGWRIFNVMSSSMEPSILTGSVVLTKYYHPSTLKEKDVITFIPPTRDKAFITHRISNISKRDNIIVITTKGDNNKNIDKWKLAGGGVVGKVLYSMPYLGYLMSFAQSKIGILVFILLPATYIIIDEIKNILKTIKHHKNKSKTINASVSVLIFFVNLAIYSPNPTYALISDNTNLVRNKYTVFIPLTAPSLDMRLSKDKKILIYKINNLGKFNNLNYLLTYIHGADNIKDGINGIEVLNSQNEFSGEIVLGTCSEKSCVYHSRVRDIELTVVLKDASGREVVLKGKVENSIDPDEFPSCTAPEGKIIAGYKTGKHEIIGIGLLSGSDYVYQLSENTKEKVMQCYCSQNGRGIQTNWIRTDDIEGYKSKGFPFSIQSGSSWNLDSESYAAQNVEYKCGDKY